MIYNLTLKRSKLYLLVIGFVFLTCSLGLAQATLSEGIIVATGKKYLENKTLAYFDPNDNSLTTWHTPPSEDTMVSIPHSWSPDGRLLAVFSYSSGLNPNVEGTQYVDKTQMCLLDRSGTVARCMAEAPPLWIRFRATWSADSQKLYYLAGFESDTDVTRLVEADVNTGETLRTIYSYTRDTEKTPIDASLMAMIWSSSLDTIGINFTHYQSHLEDGLQIIDLNSDQPTLLSAQLLNMEDSPFLNCSVLFPDEKIFALLNSKSLAIFDTTGHLLGAVQPSDLYPTKEWFSFGDVSCPTMLPSGEDLLFYADSTMYRYNFQNQLLEPLFEVQFRWQGFYFRDLALSPDQKHIVMRGDIRGCVVIIVTDFAGNYSEVPFDCENRFVDYPIWIPELP
jgi:hypothetical protein